MNKIFVYLLILNVTGTIGSENDSNSCKLKDGSVGSCVNLSSCQPFMKLLNSRDTMPDGLRFVQTNGCGFAGLETKVCCPHAVFLVNQPDIEKSSNVEPDIQEPSHLEPDDFVDQLPEPPQCGRDPKGGGRFRDCSVKYPVLDLLNGKLAYQGMSKWMALLGYRRTDVVWQCGGSVITRRHVLTAAHCIKRNLYVIRVGEVDYNEPTDTSKSSPADYLIKKAIRHENYFKYHNDIGILVTQKIIEFDDYVAPICLPIQSVSYEKTAVKAYYSNNDALILGWGLRENGTKSSHLMYSYVDKLERQVCEEMYNKFNVTIDARVICAGADKTDACEGDSGGPLLGAFCTAGLSDEYSKADFYYELGVISYGFKCSKSRYAGIYTSVEYFMPWIEEKVLNRTSRPIIMPSCEYKRKPVNNP